MTAVFTYLKHHAATLFGVAATLLCVVVTLFCPLQAQTTPTGTGLYQKQCGPQTFERYQERFVGFDIVTDTIYYDSIVCRLVEITNIYTDLTACDTITTLLRTEIDTIPIPERAIRDDSRPEGYYTITEIYDTLRYYQYEVRCRKIDTLYTYDTIVMTYNNAVYDTAHSVDTLVLYRPVIYTDTTFTFGPHYKNSYRPYADFALVLQDSIASIERQLAAMQNPQQRRRQSTRRAAAPAAEATASDAEEAPSGYRAAVDYETLAAEIVAKEYEDCNTCFTPLPIIPGDTLAIRLRDSCLNKRRAEIKDSLMNIAPITPAALRARLGAFRALLEQYSASVLNTEEYHIDSIHVLATIVEDGLTRGQDFVVRTIPLFYTRQPDTVVRSEEPVLLFAGSPYLPARPDPSGADPSLTDTTYTTIEWGMPLDAATRQPVMPAQGFFPGVMHVAPDNRLTGIHAEALYRAYSRAGLVAKSSLEQAAEPEITGIIVSDSFPTFGPIYIADTLDGDSLLFPIVARVTQANKSRFAAPPQHTGERHDTIKVIIKKGFEVRGYVSYAGLWFPSQVGDTRSHDVTTVDGDLHDYQHKHLPIENATVYLKDLETGAILDTAVSDADGYFQMQKFWMDGKYVITARSPQKTHTVGLVGLNGNDATWVQNYTIGKLTATTLPENTNPDLSMWWWASNVNLSTLPEPTKGLDGNDATDIQNKTIGKLNGSVNKYKTTGTQEWLDDWAYSVDTLYLTSDTNFHVRGVMRGDADRNYNETATGTQMRKSGRNRTPKLDIAQMGSLNVPNDIRMLDFPLISEDSGWLKGFQIFLYYNDDKVEPWAASLPKDLNDGSTNLEYNVIDDQILTTWVSKESRYFYPGDTMLMLNLKLLKKPVKNLSSFFKNNPLQYVVSDTLARIVPDWKVSMPALDVYYPEDNEERGPTWAVEFGDTIYKVGDEETPLVAQGKTLHDYSHILAVIPNPIISWGDVTYYVSQSSLVNLKLYSMMGECVATFVEGERQFGHYRLSMNIQHLPSGIYILRLETTFNNRTEFDIAKIIIKR